MTAESSEGQQLNQVGEVFAGYIKRQGDRLSHEGIYCKRHALQLKRSLEKRAEGHRYSIGKVGKTSASVPDLWHRGSGIYSFHYLVIAEIEGQEYALDPFLKNLSMHPIPKDQYIQVAFENPQDAMWSTPQV